VALCVIILHGYKESW